jgi:DNA-binding phage protein
MRRLSRVVQAFGGIPQIAKQTNLHVKTLYRTLSLKGNPELKSLTSILKAIGMRIAVQPLKPAR